MASQLPITGFWSMRILSEENNVAQDAFEKFEQSKRSVDGNPSLSRFERWSSPHTHPGLSVSRLLVQKLRVLVTYVVRRIAEGGGKKAALEGLAALEGFASGKEVLVLGSGPSAAKLNTSEARKRQRDGTLIIIATNYFLSSPLAKKLSPDYLVWADGVFHPSKRADNNSWSHLTDHPHTTVVVPWTWKRHLTGDPLAPRFLFFDNDTLEGWSLNLSPLYPRGYQGSTGAKALALGLHLEPSRVLVLGLDLSNFKNFSVDGNNRVLRHPTHLAGTDSGTNDLTGHTVHGLADSLFSMASQFLYLTTHFGNQPITNLDPDSLVDAFEKVAHHPLVKSPRTTTPARRATSSKRA